ncbi:MAG: sensor histidine kinase [Clostridiales bacterium]|jgi:sensor histidine kinase YesM|nr:sensor histidine kinase [Clostridiales bacterium]
MRKLFYDPAAKIIASFFVLIVVPMTLLVSYGYNRTQSLMDEKISAANRQAIKSITDDLGNLVLRMNIAAEIMLKDDTYAQGMAGGALAQGVAGGAYARETAGDSGYWKLVVDYHNAFAEFAGSLSDAVDCTMAYSNGLVFSTLAASSIDRGAIYESDWWAAFEQGAEHYRWIASPAGQASPFPPAGRQLSLARLYRKNRQGTGVLVISCSWAPLSAGAKESELLALVDRDGGVQCAMGGGSGPGQEELLGLARQYRAGENRILRTAGGGAWMADSLNVPNTTWRLVRMVDYTNIREEFGRLRYQNLYIPMLLFFLFVLVTLLTFRQIFRPIKQLSMAAQRVRGGDFGVRLRIPSRDALGELGNSFNQMLGNIQELLAENALRQQKILREERQKNNFRLRMLKSQIDPHFLLNTLNNIKWMAVLAGAGNVEEMLVALGRLLEFSLVKKDDMITVAEELGILADYVSLQKMSCGDSFTFELREDENARQYKVPKLMLQPLVENAIRHGAIPKKGGGHVRVETALAGGSVVFTVRDNGVGIPPGKLRELRAHCGQAQELWAAGSIGLIAISATLRLYYDGAAALSIESEQNEWTCVQIAIPIEGATIEGAAND